MKSKKIYCDEAGFTGANMLDAAQPHFTFASTDIEEERARELVDEAVVKFNLRRFQKGNGELKGADLARKPKGRQALEWLFGECRDNFLVTIHDKLFAIAGKFFDLTFEPLISNYGQFFFRTNFHRFVVTAIYIGLKTQDRLMTEAVSDFHSIFQPRNRVDGSALKTTIDKISANPASALENILHLWQLNEAKILAEYDDLSDKSDMINKWTLELSLTSLHIALNHWGAKHEVITPVCDDSKPLSELKDVVDSLGGRYKLDADYMPVFSGATINPVEFGKSHENASIQIADLVASAFNYAANNRVEPFSQRLIESHLGQISEGNVVPDMDDIDPRKEQAVRNYLTLLAIVENSKHGGLTITPEFFFFLARIQAVRLPDELLNLGDQLPPRAVE
ncbi:MAG TPA: DUF3800 domain-containing protein [Pyrinomonadaceae bacterium]|jgi:hypothetical protein|nr:DUF3800 domain-containing protein [Pyrinomonadaceae bacterium]